MLSVRVGATWNGGVPVGGTWLHGLVAFGDLAFTTAFQRSTDNSGGGGLQTIQWSMVLPTNRPLPIQLRQDCLVELFAGAQPLGAAVIRETPRGDSVVADGLFRLGEDFMAVDSTGAPTTEIDTAVSEAIGRGLRWRDPGTLPSTAVSTLSSDSAKFNTISGLLNAYCKQNAKVWMIDRDGFLQLADIPTTPTLALSPHVPNPQTADDDYASTYFIRRVDGVDVDGQPNAWAANSATDADAPVIRETAEDVEGLGYMNSTAGDVVAQAYLDANKARSSFIEGVSVTRGQVTTLGGTAPELWAVAAGEMVQQPNWMSSSGDAVIGDRQNWVIGGTQWRQGQPLTMTPMGIAARTQAQIVQRGSRKVLEFS